jgi:hypothetical protein
MASTLELALLYLATVEVATRKASGPVREDFADDFVLGAGDALVLSGPPEALALAERRLLNACDSSSHSIEKGHP